MLRTNTRSSVEKIGFLSCFYIVFVDRVEILKGREITCVVREVLLTFLEETEQTMRIIAVSFADDTFSG